MGTPSNVFAVIRTNCNSSAMGQIIKVELFANEKDAIKALDKDNCGKVEFDGKVGYWNGKKQMLSYIEEKVIK